VLRYRSYEGLQVTNAPAYWAISK